MKKIAFVLLLTTPIVGKAQTAYTSSISNNAPSISASASPNKPSNSIEVKVNNPLFFNYGTVDDLLQPQIVNNAFEVKLKAQQSANKVYAQVNFSGKKHKAVPDGWVSLLLVNKTSPNAMAGTTAVPLSEYPTLLLTQPTAVDNMEYYSFYYNVVLNPLTQHIRPDNYSFSITFTMTQP